MQRIIYTNDSGGVSVITPTPEWLESHTLEELAERVVPPGISYQIVDESAVPVTPDPVVPDWVGFRRELLSSEPWNTIASQTPYDWKIGAIMTAISLDSPDPVIVANLWNQLNKPLTTGQIEWLRGAVTSSHIPLALADNGTITPT